MQVQCQGYAPQDREWSGCRAGDQLGWNCQLDPALGIGGVWMSPVGPVVVPS